jgi:hypothetical protein
MAGAAASIDIRASPITVKIKALLFMVLSSSSGRSPIILDFFLAESLCAITRLPHLVQNLKGHL